MKRLLITVLSVCLALVLTVVSGCSCAGCNGAVQLEFNNFFLGESVTSDATVGYTETLTYKVKNADSYKETNLKKSDEVNKDVKYDYDGTYTVTLSVLNAVSLPSEIQTNIDLEGKTVYHLVSNLEISSTYTVNRGYAEGYQSGSIEDGDVLYNDYVRSETYFLGSGYSFAPIWSKTEQSYSYLITSGSDASVGLTKSESTISYNKGSYKISKYENGEVTSTSSHGYDYRSLIDNAQLLFAIRNTDISKDGSLSIPTVSTAFGSAQTLLVKNNSESTVKFNDKDVPVKNLTYAINSQYNTGTSHHVVVQKSGSNDLVFNSYVMEYAAPLMTYVSCTSMGALIYTLNSIA